MESYIIVFTTTNVSTLGAEGHSGAAYGDGREERVKRLT
jgi:hypothetical protein